MDNNIIGIHEGHITFDPFNARHRSIFRKVMVSDDDSFGSHFEVEYGFSSVREMMTYKMAMAGARVLDSASWGHVQEGVLKVFKG